MDLSYWKTKSQDYVNIMSESRKAVLHPFLIEKIKEQEAHSILDYGCGDGALFDKWDNDGARITLFDTSQSMLYRSHEKFSSRSNFLIVDNIKDVSDSSKDCVVLSLVLMTVETMKEQKQIFENIKRVKKRDGVVFVAVTHPCFRQYGFSTFRTEYTKGNEFNYFNEGERFWVELTDKHDKKHVEFQDFHWSLSNTMNIIVDSGLCISRVFELKDTPIEGGGYNPFMPPYLVFKCT